MKRPLALAGFLYLAAQLLATFGPPAALLPLAALFVLAALAAARWGGRHRAFLLLCTLVPAAAFGLRFAAQTLWIAPIQGRAGQEAAVEASVTETAAGYVDDTVRAALLVERVDGVPVRPFRVSGVQLPYTLTGERISARLRFALPKQNEYLYSQYADGSFLTAEYVDGFSVQGESTALWARAARLRESLTARLRGCLPPPYAGMAAAMAVGSRANLDSDVRETVRRAGLSHILVVSGLHLSAVSGSIYWILKRFFSRRTAGVCAMAAVLGFMMLTSFTPSVVRAGIAMLLLYAGGLFYRRSDGVTSLGAAALVMCLANPYAAVDIGFLLSCLATFGVISAADARRRSMQARRGEERNRWRRMARKLLWAALVPVSATLMTLPVIIAIDGGVSLLSVLSSLLVLPVMPVAVGAGFVTAICAGVPALLLPCRLAGYICKASLWWILSAARWTTAVPWLFVHITGAFAMCVSLLCCLLLWAAWEWREPLRRTASGVLAFVLLCIFLYAGMDTDVVRILLAGTGENPAVVILQGLQTAVLFRGPESGVNAIWEILETYNRTGVDFLIDLRANGDTEELAQALAARESVNVQEDIVNHAVYAPFGDVLLYARRQANGSFVCAEVRGARVGTASGRVELSALPALDCYIAGSRKPEGLRCRTLILPKPQSCDWLEPDMAPQICGRAEIILRAGASLTIHEVTYAVEWTGA